MKRACFLDITNLVLMFDAVALLCSKKLMRIVMNTKYLNLGPKPIPIVDGCDKFINTININV